MILTLLLLIQKINADCIANQYLTFPKQAELVYAVKRITIKLEGEYIIGYGDEYEVRDKSKISLKQVPQGIIFAPSNFEIYCPAVHILSRKDSIKCEIQLNMDQVDIDETDPTKTPQKAKFVIPIEVDKDIKSNPVFEIENNFQMRLMDLAGQLEKLAYYLEYENCDILVYIIPKPLSISTDQVTLLQKYSKSIPEGATVEEIEESNKGELYVENLSLDTNSSTHHYGLIAIVIGVIALAAIRAFSKKKEQQNNPDQQPLNQQELQNLN
ncbi:unnamed protein product [Paramecium octaurelia]|uniref:Transmembrane protein n=1 Tax=Paramecium octaurelia TaxID=43137 RepID=A0A8S1Y2F6_PAROT|nr:unnamed protein product [Paramecium octaurelia]